MLHTGYKITKKMLAGQYRDELKLLPHITEEQAYATQGINMCTADQRIQVIEQVL